MDQQLAAKWRKVKIQVTLNLSVTTLNFFTLTVQAQNPEPRIGTQTYKPVTAWT